jgi:hypothetical protein
MLLFVVSQSSSMPREHLSRGALPRPELVALTMVVFHKRFEVTPVAVLVCIPFAGRTNVQ